MDLLQALLQQLVDKFPFIASVLMLIGVLRLINKPLFAFLHAFVLATPTTKDDEALNKVEQSKFYLTVVFILDWLGSIKLPEKK